ncbi:MAG: type IV pili methyl-accepting chemotaxis transducer N-terminal domain-containing protein [Sulfurimonas sp.]|uniref:type IV pili methyl-accepting chemotaxis transducer N-terminal domain-containing protein n=1 Tax=Sulfurimonas sp. TaxID=2022749 RepID=UPI0025E70949|nr:type IV pili methyl-accepting chemotaxis transducer N-terminal domain-containing protein [Sulfurimonas sp.]MCK9492294.1 type IV pili methyl-accepting chemotaxis transducer N-terminal domain-containing protein [Sulfurimonas sp.]
MKKVTSISTKIKVLGALLIILMLSVIAITIYLNQQNQKDALIINIAGKQRMLTQKMAKNVFYIHYSSNKDFYELNSAIDEFIEGLNILRNGDSNKKISPVPTYQISLQHSEINALWDVFYKNIQNFKLYTNSNVDKSVELEEIVTTIYRDNTKLLDNVDKLVTMYTDHSESKTSFIKTFQYSAGATLLLLFVYSLLQLRSIESHVETIMQYSKKLISSKDITKLEPIEVKAESESEILEASDTINCFIQKINSAMDYSNEALLQSERASSKLQELTYEFDSIIDELKDKSLANKHLNNSEDIVIESTEELINSTRKLYNLKLELEKLTKSCQDTQT